MSDALERLTAYLQRRKAHKQTDYELIHGLGVGSEHECALLASDIEALIAAVAAARAEGMREAAKLAEEYSDWCANWGEHRNQVAADAAAKEIAAAIRAEASK